MLQNLPVRTKLVAVLALPVLVMGLLVVSRIATNVSDDRRADRLTGLTSVSAKALALTHELQKERDLSAAYVGGGNLVDRDGLVTQRDLVDQSLRDFEAEVARLNLGALRPALRQ